MGKGGQQPPRIHHGTTKDEQRAALQAFAAMDIDGDGELTADEIYHALSKNDADVTLEHVKELVAKADADGNGTVNQREYLNAVAADVMPTIVVENIDDEGVIDVEPFGQLEPKRQKEGHREHGDPCLLPPRHVPDDEGNQNGSAVAREVGWEAG